MKRFLLFALLISLSACDFYLYDSVYDSRDRIVGRYDMEEYSETFNDFTRYSLWIERSGGNSNAIWIDNFYAVNIRVRAIVSYDKITIPRQTVNGYDVEGVGTVHGERISFTYRVRNLYKNFPTDFLDGTAYKDY
ncbi:MAG: hypothetical protein OEU76_09525 [Cyclobacteriaceae bacterium]|nr:hypothetical protein [Cyclobacteriaceae bacterium]